jgi:hypothetical protein
MLQWTWTCKHLFMLLVSFPLGIYSQVLTRSYGGSVWNYEAPLNRFPLCLYQYTFPPGVHKDSFLSHPCQHVFFVFWIIASPTGVVWYLIVILLFIPWWLVLLSIFSCTCWPFGTSLSIQVLDYFSVKFFVLFCFVIELNAFLMYFEYWFLLIYI